MERLDQLNGQEQNAQKQYDRKLRITTPSCSRKGKAYNKAYAQDYGQYQDYLSRLDTLYGYYTAQEQAQVSRRQQTFNSIMTVLGVIGDVIQLAISGTTGIGSLAGAAEHRVHLGPRLRGRACRLAADAGKAAEDARRGGAQWDSNPRSPDPQSGALTDYAMGTT